MSPEEALEIVQKIAESASKDVKQATDKLDEIIEFGYIPQDVRSELKEVRELLRRVA